MNVIIVTIACYMKCIEKVSAKLAIVFTLKSGKNNVCGSCNIYFA